MLKRVAKFLGVLMVECLAWKNHIKNCIKNLPIYKEKLVS